MLNKHWPVNENIDLRHLKWKPSSVSAAQTCLKVQTCSGFCCSACCHIPPGCWQRAAQQFGQTHSSFFQVGSSCTNKHLSLWQLLFIHRIRFYAETASAHVHHSSPWTPDVLMLSQHEVSSYCSSMHFGINITCRICLIHWFCLQTSAVILGKCESPRRDFLHI